MTEVLKAINAIKVRIAEYGGISKGRTAPQGYAFRGIEDFDQLLCGLTAEHGLVITPEILKEEHRETVTSKGARQVHAFLKVRWHFASAKDDSKTFADTYGEALDTSDKASNKAIQASRKYADVCVFRIPVQGDNTEAYVPEAAPQQAPPPPPKSEPKVEQQAAPPPAQANGAKPGPARARAPKQAPAKAAEQPAPEPAGMFDGSRAPSEEILGAIGETNTFEALFARAKDAEQVADQAARAELFQAIKMRGVVLFATAKDLGFVRTAEPLVLALGKPAELMKAGSEAFARLRTAQ